MMASPSEEFKGVWRLKPELWLGCKVKETTTRESKNGISYPVISFSNFPWMVIASRRDVFKLLALYYGCDRRNWPIGYSIWDLIRPGDLFNVQVSPQYQGSKCYVYCRIVWGH